MTTDSRRAILRLVLLATFVTSAAALLPGNSLGLGVGLVGVAFAAYGATISGERGKWNSVFLFSGLLLLAFAAIRDASWIVVPGVLGGATCLVFALWPPEHLWDTVRGAFPFLRILQGWRSAASLVESSVPSDASLRSKPLLRGLGLTLPLVGFFGVLFASADSAFARLMGEAVLVDVDVALVPARIATAGWAFAIAGGMHAGLGRGTGLVPSVWHRDPWKKVDPEATARTASPIEWLLPLGSLNLLFIAFVLVQFAVLFGGRAHVLATTGLTYAEYARSGFFQLLVVAGVVLLILEGARTFVTPATPREKRTLEVLLASLAVLTVVVLWSAMFRLGLYEETFGASRARFEARLIMVWLASLLLMAIARGSVPKGPWLLRGAVLSAAVTMLVGLASNPDDIIARSAVNRFEATGEFDAYYLGTLSADAIPELLSLPEAIRACVVNDHAAGLVGEDPWPAWNLGRERARDALSEAGPDDPTACPIYGIPR